MLCEGVLGERLIEPEIEALGVDGLRLKEALGVDGLRLILELRLALGVLGEGEILKD